MLGSGTTSIGVANAEMLPVIGPKPVTMSRISRSLTEPSGLKVVVSDSVPLKGVVLPSSDKKPENVTSTGIGKVAGKSGVAHIGARFAV